MIIIPCSLPMRSGCLSLGRITGMGALVFMLQALLAPAAASTSWPATDRVIVTLNTLRAFPEIANAAEWTTRAAAIREQALISCGLWPMPEKTPLNARIFDRIERDGYTIEKVWIETLPGFYLGGNLYRPRGKQGPFPAILNPHGHWKDGRLTDVTEGSIPARCINFARQGMIAFSYDMIGYNDTRWADCLAPAGHRQFGTNRTDLLWNITPMGLQTWNSIRALDFLESLPDVDKKRFACTGASGGGTQTFMLGAIDDRLAAQAPAVMVSHTMQGGCVCENAPGLRIDFSNVEVAAAAAPRPQILVAATGDWTRATLTMEGPAIARVYRLLTGADEPGRFVYKRFDYGHNYNRESREAVYEFFGRWLLRHPDPASLKELPYEKEPDANLRVFPGDLPANALSKEQLVALLKQRQRDRWNALLPKDRAGLEGFRRRVRPAWRRTLQLPESISSTEVETVLCQTNGNTISASLKIRQTGSNAAISASYVAPASIVKKRHPDIVVIAAAEPGNHANELAEQLVSKGIASLVITDFSTPEAAADQFANFYTTYNRTLLQERVADLLVACAAAPGLDPRSTLPFRVTLLGTGVAGPWALLAAPAASATVADCGGFNLQDEQSLLDPSLFCPGILNVGGFDGLASLAAPKPLLLHHTGNHFDAATLSRVYKSIGASRKLRTESQRLSPKELVAWINRF